MKASIPQQFILLRITASFFFASGRIEEARTWAIKSYQLGIEKGLSNRRITPLLQNLGICFD